MPGLFDRLKNWVKNENFTDEDINAEFNWLIQNLIPSKIDDYSQTVTQMRLTTDPGESGSESQATSTAGEIERLRHAIKEITGKTYWYESPTRSLEAGTVDMNLYMPFDGTSLAEVLANTIRRGAIPNAGVKTTQGLNTDDFQSAVKKFGNYAFAIASGNYLCASSDADNPYSQTISAHFYGMGGTQHIAYNPLMGIELYIDGSGHLVTKVTEAAAATESTKASTSVTGTTAVNGVNDWKHILAKFQLNGIAGAGTDAIGMSLDGTAEGTPVATDTISINVGDGGAWFFGAAPNPATSWSKFSAMSVVPSAEASDAWTKTGAGSTTVAGGILSMSSTSAQQSMYSKTTNIDLSAMMIDFKLKYISGAFSSTIGASAHSKAPFIVKCRDDSMNRAVELQFNKSGIIVALGDGTVPEFFIPLDTTKWHIYRLVSTGATNPVQTLYVDGVPVSTWLNDAADATAADTIAFGDIYTDAGHTLSCELEWFAYALEVKAPVTLGSSGYLDDICVFAKYLNDTSFENSLVDSKASDVSGRDRPVGNFSKYSLFPGLSFFASGGTGFDWASVSTLATIAEAYVDVYFPSDGKTPIAVEFEGRAYLDANDVCFFGLIDPDLNGIDPADGGNPYVSASTQLIHSITGVTANEMKYFSMRNKRVYPAGLVHLSYYMEASGANQAVVVAQRLNVDYHKVD